MTQLMDGTQAAQFDRLPPHDTDMEMCLLASMIIDPDACRDVLHLIRRDDWFSYDNQTIFDAIKQIREADRPLDIQTVRDWLKTRGLLDDIGGVPYLAQVLSSVPSSAHAKSYADAVIGKARVRRIIAAANQALQACYLPMTENGGHRIAEQLHAALDRALEGGHEDEIYSIEQLVHEVTEDLSSGPSPVRPTGFASLDAAIGGLPIGGTTIIGARPRVGKTQLCLNIALRIALGGTPVGIISIEEGRKRLCMKYLANLGEIENRKLVTHSIHGQEWNELAVAGGKLSQAPIWIADSPDNVPRIAATSLRMVRKHECHVIIVDHIHLLDDQTGEGRTNDITKISRGLKLLWKRLNVAGVEAAQLNRGNETGQIRPPMLRDLRESGAIEQDGDLILLLHRQDVYRRDPREHDGFMDVNVAKIKHGCEGTVRMKFNGAWQRIEECEQPADPNYDPFAGED